MKLQVEGFEFAGVAAGIKKRDKLDLGLIRARGPSGGPVVVAGAFTQSCAAAAPVKLSAARVAGGRCGALVVNSGNANACTGSQGMADAEEMSAHAARLTGGAEETSLVASTGVIGNLLPMEKVRAGVEAAAAALSPEGGERFAEAILTSDAGAKTATAEAELDGARVRVVGFAKGAGMIMPDMRVVAAGLPGHATMLAFLCTDAKIDPGALAALTGAAVQDTFNAITVDGDTSTNDSVYVLASGHAGEAPLSEAGVAGLGALLEQVMRALAQEIVLDGEGARRAFELRVEGARTVEEADAVARRVANSPLVKTAVYGADANWGRIIAAAATAGVTFDPEAAELEIAGRVIYSGGRWAGPEAEAEATAGMQGRMFTVRLDLAQGDAARTLWASDLGVEYVRFNGDYRS